METTKNIKNSLNGWFFAIIAFGAIIVMAGITMTPYDVVGANITNYTVKTIVNITNTEPVLYSVTVNPTLVDLNPGTVVNVTCNGSVYDINGWNDIKNVSATLFNVNYGKSGAADNNFRYINTNCTNSSGGANCALKDGFQTNASCVCVFSVWYYAEAGSWQCNMTVGDIFALNSTNWSSTFIVNTDLGIDVPATIDFGNLSVTETSNYIRENVTNWGNVFINTSVRGYGGSTDNNNVSMICETGNITHDYMRYALNTSAAYSSMINITNISTAIPALTIPPRTDDARYGNSTNATFWKVQIPAGVGGNCSGTLVFGADYTA